MKEKTPNDEIELFTKKVSRRNMLKTAGVGGIGVVVGASGLGGLLNLSDSKAKGQTKDVVPFYGAHQAGITTEAQDNLYFASLEVTTDKRSDLIQLFKDWTEAAAQMTAGNLIGEASLNANMPPKDTGEAKELSPSNLTITFGVGPTLFSKDGKDRFGLKSKTPAELKDLPKFPLDALEDSWNGGDICIQACADDLQVAFHAVRNLVRIGRGKVIIHWAQTGFQRTKQADSQKTTPRNLFGFKDGTVNPDTNNSSEMNEHVWVKAGDGPDWLVGGSYMVVRRIQMYIEVWDRTVLREQENTFGRHRDSGAPLGMKKEFDSVDLEAKDPNGNRIIPEDSHMSLSRGDGKAKILRRPYSYADGMDPKTGSFNAGLLFICFQRRPSKQFIPIQERLAKNDKLNEYIVHRGSAMFACLPGAKKGGYIGDSLFG
ncbi:iron uptake transporter deferrochelatase/peroxidase subunit [Peribacillus sp. NPDC097895]|uniref:iron uptake transporter deferrochelatase/peroxidase subunit n=1 Tax=Peribacillus sp. NPDC097895 TaxID=3390619 RepID=UPI003D00A8C9